MADHGRAAAMDPPHITEFASERYFEKLQQLQHHQHQQHNAGPHQGGSSASVAVASGTGFILPLRASRSSQVDHAKPIDSRRDKSRFFHHIRHRVSLRHPKPEIEPGYQTAHQPPLPKTATDSARKKYTCSGPCAGWSRDADKSVANSVTTDQRFLSLPNELQIQIISLLPLTDILNLRLASKTWHALVTLNEGPIVRHHLEHHLPAYALRLYPVRDPSEMNFYFLCSLWHRLHVSAKLAFLMCEWITKDIFLRQTDAQRAAFAPQHERMRRRLTPLLFVLFHFFETYRKLHLRRLAEHGGNGLLREPYTANPIETQIMNTYDDQTLLRVHEIFPLVISSFCRRLRPPTYVGRVERSLRGYLRERPPDEVHAAILCLGGLRQVERLWEIKGYSNRRSAVDGWIASLTREPPGDAPARGPRLGLRGFGRKKSLSGEGGCRATWASGDAGTGGWDVFGTSLAGAAPMAPLERDQAQSLLLDLPVLQHVWVVTAEAMILQRKVVQRPQDIKRNQQVMLDLIREDGLDEEDEWWYGRSFPDSIRPPAGAVYDDAD